MNILKSLDYKLSNPCWIELDFGKIYFRTYKTGYIYDGPLYLWTKINEKGKFYKDSRRTDYSDINNKIIEYIGPDKRDHDCYQIIADTPPIIPVFEPAVASLRYLFQQSVKDKGGLIIVKPIVFVRLFQEITPVEERIVKEVIEQLGAREVIFTTENRPVNEDEFRKLLDRS